MHYLHLKFVVFVSVSLLGAGLASCGGTDSSSKAAPPESKVSATGGSGADLKALLPANVRDAGVLKMGTDPTYPPFGSRGPDNTITGLDVDLARAAAERLGLKLKVSSVPFTGLITSVQSGRLDVTMNGVNDLTSRHKTVTFVDYGAADQSGLLVLKGNPKGIDVNDLCGKKLAIIKGSNERNYIKDKEAACQEPNKIVEFAADADAQLAVRTGRVDASVSGGVTVEAIAKTAGGGATYDAITFQNPALSGIRYGAIVNKNAGLEKALQPAFQGLVDDGTYKRLLEKYGVGSIAIPKITINAGGKG